MEEWLTDKNLSEVFGSVKEREVNKRHAENSSHIMASQGAVEYDQAFRSGSLQPWQLRREASLSHSDTFT